MSSKKEKNYLCEFCNNSFATSYNLKNHQKTAKFCLDIQNKPIDENFKCDFCNKGFSLKAHFNGHILICKDKKAVEEKEQNKKLIDRIKELEKENNELKLKLSVQEELNKKLQEDNKEFKKLIKRPINTTTINNNDNRQQNQYNIQFNQLFEKLPVLNEINVTNRINELSSEENIDEYDLDHFYPESLKKIIHQIKDLSFCTDPSRKIVVIKDESEKSVKMNAEEFLSKSFILGSESILKHITFVDQMVNERVDNSDPRITIEMLDHFNDDRDKFIRRMETNKDNFFISSNQSDNKVESTIVTACIKQLNKCSK